MSAENSTSDSFLAKPFLKRLNFSVSYKLDSLLAASSIFCVVAED